MAWRTPRSDPSSGDGPSPEDALELALRRLPHVEYVGLRDQAGTQVVQVLTSTAADVDALRRDCQHLCESHLDGAFVLELPQSGRPSRIRLLDVERPGPDEVVVHLGFNGRCTSGRARGGDPAAAAEATFEALTGLGADVPFHVEAAAVFEHHVGDGVMIVLSDGQSPRYGVAGGSDAVNAGARATLHALNRYLSTQTLRAAIQV